MIEREDNLRIVVTGYGAISSLGAGVERSWQGIINQESGIKKIEPSVNSRVSVGGKVVDFRGEDYFARKDLKRIHPSAQFAYAASLEALEMSNLLDKKTMQICDEVDQDLVGIRVGTGIGGATQTIADVEDIILERGDDKISPWAMLLVLPERVSSVSSIKLNARGEVAATVAACATGSICIIDAIRAIRCGDAEVMVAGGSESAIDKIGVGSFAAMRALTEFNGDPTKASRPFDKEASGFVMAEGAGVLVLESLEHALKRGAEIKAEIVSYWNCADASHDTAPSGEGAMRAMRNALKRAALKGSDIDYINAHGTSTPTGDGPELDAIKGVFSEEDLTNILISSTKSATGHMLGAAGGFEAIMAIKAIERGIVPPTLNLDNPIRSGLDLVPWESREREVRYALSNSFGFGGLNSVLIFGRYNP